MYPALERVVGKYLNHPAMVGKLVIKNPVPGKVTQCRVWAGRDTVSRYTTQYRAGLNLGRLHRVE